MPNQPQNTPTVSKPTPVVLDELLIETTDSNQAPYDRKLEFGHFYPDQIRYPGFRFLAAKPTQYGQMQYLWGNGFTAQDGYNAAKDYSGDANAYPIFVRSYRVLRSDYLVTGPSTKGTAFTGIAAIAVTAGGTGYTEDFAATFSGGAGTGAAATAIVSNGAVVRLEITAVGTGYTSAPTVAFGAGAGSGAAATAVIQPVTAILVSEKHTKLPDDDPYTSLYDKVTLVYETLPGPWLPFTRNDIWLGPIQGHRRAVLNSSQAASLTATTRTTYEAREGSSIVAWEMVETNTDGTGGNPFPLFDQRIYEDERGPVETISQLVVRTGTETPSISESGGIYTHVDYQIYPENQYLLKKVTETFQLSTPTLPDLTDNEDGTKTTTTRLIKLASDITEQDTLSGNVWVRISSKAVNTLLSWEITAQRPVPGNNVIKSRLDVDGARVQITELMSTVAAVGAITPRESIATGVWTRIYSEKVSDLVCVKITEQRAVPGVAVQFDRNDSVLGPVAGTRQLVVESGQVSSLNGTTRTTYEPHNNSSLVVWEIVETNATPGQPLSGQRYLSRWDVVIRYIARVVGYTGASGSLHVTGLEGDAGTEITPVDEAVARTEVLDLDAVREAILGKFQSWESNVAVPLPNVLIGINIVYNENHGDGEDSFPASQQATESFGTAWTKSLNPSARAQASASVMPEIIPLIKYYNEAGRNLLATNYVFYLAGNITQSDISTRLAEIIGGSPTLTFLDRFLPQGVRIVCFGQQAEVSANADTRTAVNVSGESFGYSWRWGGGSSNGSGVSCKTTDIPPTLHGAVVMNGLTVTDIDISVSVEASTPEITVLGEDVVAAISNSNTVTGTATGSVVIYSNDDTIPATNPTTIPTAGLVIVDTNVSPIEYGLLAVHAAVVNMSQLSGL